MGGLIGGGWRGWVDGVGGLIGWIDKVLSIVFVEVEGGLRWCVISGTY